MKITRQILGQKLEDNVGMSVKVDNTMLTFDLTDEEIERAYRLRRAYYNKCDLFHKINGMIGSDDDWDNEINCDDEDEIEIGNVTLTGKRLKEIVNNPDFMDGLEESFENALEQNDSYWESFWITAEEVIEEAIEDEMKEEK